MTVEELLSGKIFLIDKPLDWTSFDVVKKMKYQLQNKYGLKKLKIGHAGTLDPKATGLLIVCAGKATKTIPEIQNTSKVYTGTITLGATTPSFDTETQEENKRDVSHLKTEDINGLENYFKGVFLQTPPIYSALKKEGKRLYEYARNGIDIKASPREIEFYDFKITKIDLPHLEFYVHCSKGTYIRSLANDAGEKLGVGGYLLYLRREKIGQYSVSEANNDILEAHFI